MNVVDIHFSGKKKVACQSKTSRLELTQHACTMASHHASKLHCHKMYLF